MPIDLNLVVGKRVFVQVKSLTYIIGKQQGQLMPAMMADDKGNPVPLTVDYLLGTIERFEHNERESFALKYTLPDGTKMKALVDPEFVQCLFFEDDSRIELTSLMPDQPVGQS